ncbi:MAG TPA: glycine betaine ABC transporter substrate-binding protein [Thermoanaerobaculia bacterium]|jgi:pyrroloquinoline quinone biosynthesis protein B
MRNLVIVIVLLLAACRGEEKPIVVGSKNFTESVLLGELLAQKLESAGCKVERRLNMGGTFVCDSAIRTGSIDTYVEYSGTALTAILKQPSADVRAAYDKAGLRWSPPLGFNNTFAMIVRKADAQKYGLRTVSDLARMPNIRPGFGYEFTERPDGWAGLKKAYGLNVATQPRTMDLGLTYKALASGEVDLIAGNSTDGLIDPLGLLVLEDDRRYFPPYEAVVVARKDLDERCKGGLAALESLKGAIDDDAMRRMNYLVDGEKRDVGVVVREFLGGPRVPRVPRSSSGSSGSSAPFTLVLGVAQDGGYPQAGCNRPDCAEAWHDRRLRHRVASLAIVDPESRQRWIIDATPDFPSQLRTLDEVAPRGDVLLDGILLTHAHIGHYLGLAQLGREVLGAKGVPVHAMPRMREFLSGNGPWDQLVRLGNITLAPLEDGMEVALNARIRVTPLRVPHRDEYSETVAFLVRGPSRAVLWLPDIDKWEKWATPLESVLERADVAYLDGTFHDANELPGRNLAEIPHPLIVETVARLAKSPLRERVRYVHLNQSNPLLRASRSGIQVAKDGERQAL